MDNSNLDFKTLADKNKTRCESQKGFNHKIVSWGATDWACAVAGEAGEMCNLVKKLKRVHQGIEPDKTLTSKELIMAIGKELADIVIYADLFCTRLGLDLGSEVKNKFNETSEKIKSDIKL